MFISVFQRKWTDQCISELLIQVCLFETVLTRMWQCLIVTLTDPLPSSRYHLSCDDCLEVKREYYQNCSVLCCVQQLFTVIRTHIRAVLKDDWWFRFSFSFYRQHCTKRNVRTRRYLIYSEADFEDFRPTGATRCTDGGEIWHGGGDQRSPPPRQISPSSVQQLGYRTPKTEIFTEIWSKCGI